MPGYDSRVLRDLTKLLRGNPKIVVTQNPFDSATDEVCFMLTYARDDGTERTVYAVLKLLDQNFPPVAVVLSPLLQIPDVGICMMPPKFECSATALFMYINQVYEKVGSLQVTPGGEDNYYTATERLALAEQFIKHVHPEWKDDLCSNTVLREPSKQGITIVFPDMKRVVFEGGRENTVDELLAFAKKVRLPDGKNPSWTFDTFDGGRLVSGKKLGDYQLDRGSEVVVRGGAKLG